ncbi:MAG TPA: DUF481 domain-containing protein [Terracidiphilus sp.]|jgi:Protein of unknown function, DUF481
MPLPDHALIPSLFRGLRLPTVAILLSGIAFGWAQSKPAAPAPNPTPDVLVLVNGDTLHGKFVSETAGKVTFHSDPLGDVSLTWDKVKELHTSEKFGVLNSKNIPTKRSKHAVEIPEGTLDVADQKVTIHPDNGAELPSGTVKDAQFIMDQATLDKQINHEPGFFAGWNGPATAGATLVTATQNQYTFTGALGLIRAVPTVSWLAPRNRTSIDFSASYGKITQPGYEVPASSSTPANFVAAQTTKTAIFHADAERDEYFTPRVFALAQTAFDHNFSQSLALQQIYGGGIGWSAIKTPKQELDLKATVQYESQQFIPTPATPANPVPPASTPNMNLVGSTISANYVLTLKKMTFTQSLSYIPSYNQPNAYSANEVDTLTLPAYKNLGFSVGTLDSYLNDVPITEPPTKPNSFQFTLGLTYAIKSKY